MYDFDVILPIIVAAIVTCSQRGGSLVCPSAFFPTPQADDMSVNCVRLVRESPFHYPRYYTLILYYTLNSITLHFTSLHYILTRLGACLLLPTPPASRQKVTPPAARGKAAYPAECPVVSVCLSPAHADHTAPLTLTTTPCPDSSLCPHAHCTCCRPVT
jgi:hypothetical protein